MNKKEVAELKKRFTKTSASFTRMTGCYVNAAHEKVCTLGGSFSDLPEDEFYKYLEIAARSLSGSVGNNLLTLSFPDAEEGDMQTLLFQLHKR